MKALTQPVDTSGLGPSDNELFPSRDYFLSGGFLTMGMRLKIDADSVSELKTSQTFNRRIEIPATGNIS